MNERCCKECVIVEDKGKFVGKFRNYCFTSWQVPKLDDEKISYSIYQQEKCAKTGRIHYQGYLELDCQLRYTELKKIMNDNKVHIEARKGTQAQAIAYCMKLDTKDGECVIEGAPKMQGRHTELESIYDAVKSGMTAKEIQDEFKGQAIKNAFAIKRALEVEHNLCPIDLYILKRRHIATIEENASKDSGNTETESRQKTNLLKKAKMNELFIDRLNDSLEYENQKFIVKEKLEI